MRRTGCTIVSEEPIPRDSLEQPLTYLDDKNIVVAADESNVTAYLKQLQIELGSLRVEFDTMWFSLMLEPGSDSTGGLPALEVYIQDHVFFPLEEESDEAAVERMQRLFSFLGVLYEQLLGVGHEPLYVLGLRPSDRGAAIEPGHVRHVSREELLNDEIPGIYWFQILPPRGVEQTGDDQLLSAPVFRTERLSAGAVLVVVDRGVHISGAFQHGIVEVSEYLEIPWDHGRA